MIFLQLRVRPLGGYLISDVTLDPRLGQGQVASILPQAAMTSALETLGTPLAGGHYLLQCLTIASTVLQISRGHSMSSLAICC